MNARCYNEVVDDLDRWDTKSFLSLRGGDFAQGWKIHKSADSVRRLLKPGQTYSKRSMKLAQLRSDAAALGKLGFEETTPPSALAMRSAETLINGLWEGCLDFNLEVSHDGEINFLFGDHAELFHIHIDENGILSFYCKRAEGETFGDDMSAGEFPNKSLLSFVDRRK
ncbi:MAG TPA: hypothetical protein VN612_17135 [Acidobacteriaceae bacterium]|nr:hypothetical protein [Acidobacteriaceae bacterium]